MGAESKAPLLAGRYRVEGQLGSGGMGVVHRVWDSVARRPVALKALSQQFAADEAMLELFEREFYALSNLAHPHVVAVYDYGFADGPFYTMELLEGATVNTLSPLPWRRVCSILRDAASALALIHSRRLVHRDVTWRNIHVDHAGTVKLIDFGSLTPMGVARDCVGTPAFMAPEVVQRLALDQRTDLYALGVAAYHMLTGLAPYPARQISDLHAAWSTRPQRLSVLVPDIAGALEELVMALMHLSPAQRPSDASSVIARLTAIAGLPREPAESVARAFLATPALVGRDRELLRVRAAISEATKGHGGALIIRGEASLGRSRLLDVVALEAQLAGALVLRADARDAETAQALRAALTPASDSARPSTASHNNLDDAQLCDWLTDTSQTRCVVVIVDDVQLYCLPALAVLHRIASLSRERSLLLVASHVEPVPRAWDEPIRLLARAAETITLESLAADDTLELLRSCFGSSPNLKVIADFCHSVSGGRPAVCLTLAQHLLDTRVVTYADGGFNLPDSLAGFQLPANAEQLIEQRIARLDADQRLWGQLLSLVHAAAPMTSADCVLLMQAQMSRARSRAALAGLSAQQLIMLEGAYVQMQTSVRNAFASTLSQQGARELHRLLAQHLSRREDYTGLSAAAYHYQLSGDSGQARLVTTRSVTMGLLSQRSDEAVAHRALPFGEWCSSAASTLEQEERAGVPPHELYPLYLGLMSIVSLSEPAWLARCEPYFDALKRDVGLDYWSNAEIDALLAGERVAPWKLPARLARAWLRHRQTPPARRGLPPTAALKLLATYATTALAACNATQTFHTGVPPLARAIAPFRRLSPALDLIFELLVGAADAGRGLEAGWTGLSRVMKLLEAPIKGMPESYADAARDLVAYMDAVVRRAPMADPCVLEVAKRLEASGSFAAQAEQLRMIYYLYTGDPAEAERHKLNLDALSLTTARANVNLLPGKKDVAQAQALCGDASGLRATIESLEGAAQRYPAWRGQLLLYRGEYALLLGDPQGAKQLLREALDFSSAGESTTWPKATAPYIEALLQLAQVDEAARFAESAVARSDALGISSVYRRQLDIAAALAWSAAGDHARARRQLEAACDAASAAGARGVSLIVLELARLQLATAARDRHAYERAKLALSGQAAVPALVSRYKRLLDRARRAGMEADTRSGGSLPRVAVDQALLASLDAQQPERRLQQALELVLQQCDADAGLLFVVAAGQPRCVAAIGISASEPRAARFVGDVLGLGTAASLTVSDDETRLFRWTADDGLAFDPVLLSDRTRAVGAPRAVALVHARSAGVTRPLRATFIDALVATLRARGDLPDDTDATLKRDG